MIIHPTLYSKTSTGATQIWFAETQDDKIRTTSGQKDGEKVITAWSVCEPKNEGKKNATTGAEQAEKEVRQLYKKKLKDKYFLSESEIGGHKFFRPMLAKSYSDYKEKLVWKDGLLVQNKYNGMRCVATIRGLHTRKGEPIVSVPHIWESIKHVFVKNPEAILDGELYSHEYRQKLNELIKLCRKSVNVTPEDLAESERIVRYYIYDGALSATGLEMAYAGRHLQVHDELSKTPYYKSVETWRVFSKAEMTKIYDKLVAEGNEGVILRVPHTPYENKRTKNLLKYKPIDSDEFEIVSIEEGEGDWAAKAKRIGFKMASGEIFHGAFKGSMEQASQVLKDKEKWIGKTVTAYFNGYTGLGTPQFCQFDIDQWDSGDR